MDGGASTPPQGNIVTGYLFGMHLRPESVTTINYRQGNSSETSSEKDLSHIVPAAVSYLIGSIMATVFTVGLLENCTVLFVYARSPKLKTVNNSFIIGLCLSDTGQIVFNIPFVIAACFSRRWIFGHSACLYIGFVTTFFGLTQISLLCIIALERYFIIVHQSRKMSATKNKAAFTIFCCFMYGGSWALGPLFGWSEYTLVAGEISCSINWTIKNNLYLSYILMLFCFVWFIPLSIIIFGYIRIAMLVFNEKSRQYGFRSSVKQRKSRRERRVALTVLIMIGAFVVSWTPYSIVALLSAFGDMKNASSGVYLAPAVFAKASFIWNPLIYTARHREFRHAWRASFKNIFRRVPQDISQRDNISSNTIRVNRVVVNSEQSSKAGSYGVVLEQNGFPCGDDDISYNVCLRELTSLNSCCGTPLGNVGISSFIVPTSPDNRSRHDHLSNYVTEADTSEQSNNSIIERRSSYRAKSDPMIKHTLDNMTTYAQLRHTSVSKAERPRPNGAHNIHTDINHGFSSLKVESSNFATSAYCSENQQKCKLNGSCSERNSSDKIVNQPNRNAVTSAQMIHCKAANGGPFEAGMTNCLAIKPGNTEHTDFSNHHHVENRCASTENVLNVNTDHHRYRRRRKFSNMKFHRFLDLGKSDPSFQHCKRSEHELECNGATSSIHAAMFAGEHFTGQPLYDLTPVLYTTKRTCSCDDVISADSVKGPEQILQNTYDLMDINHLFLETGSNVKQSML